jgi:hypothetical protein
VIMRVFEGGDGWIRGGKSERSKVSGGLFSLREDGEPCGVAKSLAIVQGLVCVSATIALSPAVADSRGV